MRAQIFIVMSLTILCGYTRAQSLQTNPPVDLSIRNRDAVVASRDEVASQRRDLIGKGMNLTPDEARQFWPVYDAYAAETAKISDQTVNLITMFADGYRTLSDKDAYSLAMSSLEIERLRNGVKQRYAPRFAAVLPGKKVARFIQLDRRLDAVAALNVTQAISLVE
ncbi:hypothetical protein Acid345_4073 [Candidatus Koribacter versatilis Ellin345]|uniref:Uncharacterized protein n=2 Tax=Candidatus Korobacter versatilis TaxID=658062 RepID=Q1IJ77_KORVE|nr:hypothetical protein Acid345_4073 [Candidatus Koribacter versatilis Ellin345]